MLKVPKTIKGSKPYIEENQKGFIEITKDLIKNNSEALLNVFKYFIPLEVYYLKEGIITYLCLSKHFINLEQSEIIPYYECIYNSLEKTCTFVERK